MLNSPALKEKNLMILKDYGQIDPENIDDYLAQDGYKALKKVLSGMKPEQVIDEIKKSGLRGRGGVGFPTGIKWELCRRATGNPKYLICNADEGNPGAFVDKCILEGIPQLIIEGMVIGAYAIGAQKGFIYLRDEYPQAFKIMSNAIKQAVKKNFLGENILGAGFNFFIDLVPGAGAYVCGEETALMTSIEGNPGRPWPRPPYPVEKGLWGKPTNINNVETWANVPFIILKGAEWYNSIGTEKSKGTKLLSLAGKINNKGVFEVPMGTPLRTIIYNLGGGIPNNKKFKAVQSGGPSGGFIAEEYLDLLIDYESLTTVGAALGKGGLIVLDEDNCMVDVALHFMNFTQKESCGKCVPCRLGTKQMELTLKRIVNGQGRDGDIEDLKKMGEDIKLASFCGLGQAAPNPVLSSIEFFKDEYVAHIKEKKCPALVCKALISFVIDSDLCTGCGICVERCPSTAIVVAPGKIYRIEPTKCIKCGICFSLCTPKFKAVKKVSPAL